MPMYKYQVREGGAVTAGSISAESLAEAASVVRAQGAQLVDISPASGDGRGVFDKIRHFSVDFGPGLKDVLNFTSELSVMMKAGISIRDAVAGIAEQTENPKFRTIIIQIRDDVEAGKPFSEALARHPKVFNPLYVNMVKASEMSGNFGHMLERIAIYLRQQLETRSMVRGAMVYPVMIGVMAMSTTIFLLTFVLPKFSGIFEGKEAIMPKPTVILLALSAFMRNFWYLCVGIVGLAVGSFLYFIRTPFGRRWWDAAKLKLPLLKRMFRALYITRGLQTMGEMVNAGVPMLETLLITAEVSGNTLFRNMWLHVHGAVKEGKKIVQPLSQYKLLPKGVIQMISAGEESGKLGEVMSDVADHYSKELRNIIKAVTAMIEPLMIVAMGFVVGFIAMSIILPIFKLSQLAK